jgi:hypothetical protein
MLKQATNFVLASKKSSTYSRERAAQAARGGWMKKGYASGPLRHWALTDSRPSADVKTLGHCRLTDSPARTNVALFIHRAVRLIILPVADLVCGLVGRPV